MGYHVLQQMQQGMTQASSDSQKCEAHRRAMNYDHSFCKKIYKEDLLGD